MSRKRIKAKALEMARLRFLVAEEARLKGKMTALETELREAQGRHVDRAEEIYRLDELWGNEP